MPNKCKKIAQLYKQYTQDVLTFRELVQGEVLKTEVQKLLDKKSQINASAKEIQEIINADPYEVERRDTIAREHGFSYLTTFTSEGTALGIREDKPTQIMIVGKDGEVIHLDPDLYLTVAGIEAGFHEARIKSVAMSGDRFLVQFMRYNADAGNYEYYYVYLDEKGIDILICSSVLELDHRDTLREISNLFKSLA